MTLAEIKAAAEESLSHTWSGREIPFGSSIPSAFRDAVRAEKANARNVLWLLSRCEELAEALEGLMGVAEMAMPDSYFQTDSRVNAARAALARLEGSA